MPQAIEKRILNLIMENRDGQKIEQQESEGDLQLLRPVVKSG
jgi:hypothetical protein